MTDLLSPPRAAPSAAARGRARRPDPDRSAATILADLVDLRRRLGDRQELTGAVELITHEARRLLAVRCVRTTITTGGRDDTTVESIDFAWPTSGHRPTTVAIAGEDGRVMGRIDVDPGRGRTMDPVDRQILASLAQLEAEVIAHGTTEQRLRAIVGHAPAAIFLKDRELRYVLANQRAAELAGLASPDLMMGRTDADFLDPESAAAIMAADRAILDGAPSLDDESENVLPGGNAVLHAQIFATLDQFGRPSGVGGVVSDVSARRRAEAALAESDQRYRMIFEQANEGIVLLDRSGRYLDANPAACGMFGRTRKSLLGSAVDDLVVDGSVHWANYLLAVSAADPEQAVVRGDMELRRRDGRLIVAEFVAGPQAASHVMVIRDVTDARRRELTARQRLEVIGAIRALSASDDIRAIAAGLDRAIVDLGGFGGAGVFAFTGRATVENLDAQLASGLHRPDPWLILPPAASRRVRRRSRTGPWIDDWAGRGLARLGLDLDALEVNATACLPLKSRGEVVGMLAIATRQSADDLASRLPDLEEFADLASALLGRALVERSQMDGDRRRIRRVIDRAAFRPVFQPIVDLETLEVVGYEGLTRFADGTPPDRAFEMAAAAGIGIDLEIATLEAILEASGPLPANRHLDINVSPALILLRAPLRALLRDAGFNVVVEITEHAVIDDYPALRAAIESLGDRVTLAVDDAGSGFASLRHILELQPAYVKLDRTLIDGIDRDPSRQAMVAGLKEYAVRLGVILIAEGVEREEERAMLLDLGLQRAQGYLFSRPMSAERLLAADRARKGHIVQD